MGTGDGPFLGGSGLELHPGPIATVMDKGPATLPESAHAP